ncbi:14695_t:CDS:2, partial [Gigaspora rosea]
NSGRPPADIWEEFNSINNGTEKHKGASCKVPKEIRMKVLRDIQNAYFDAKEAIDKAKKKRANQSLIKWIVSSGILFSAFDNPYFEDYTKALNPSYDPPKRTDLTTSILDSEAANIIIKVLEQEHQIFICANNVKNLINDRQFWIDIEQLRNILGPLKRAVKNVEFRTTSLADIFVELIKMAIAIQETKMIEIWKQIGGGDISADPFDDEFIPSDTITDWWLSIDLKKNEDHIKTLTLKVLSVLPHNATCEQLFSILNWYLGKRQT